MLRTNCCQRVVEPLRLSERFDVSPDELIRLIPENDLEVIVAKRRGSLYEPGRRSGAWRKMRVSRGQEFVIGGHIPTADTFESIIIGYYEGKDLMYAARVRVGFVPSIRAGLSNRFRGLDNEQCPFKNLPEARKGRSGEGLTAAFNSPRARSVRPRLGTDPTK